MKLHRAPTESDTLVWALYPHGGNASNSSDRYDEVARRSGFDIIAAHAPGTGELWPNSLTRDRLRTGSMQWLVDDFAATVRFKSHELRTYRHVIGWGDSGRAVDVMALQLRGAFDGILTRDGINLHRHPKHTDQPERIRKGLSRLLQYGGVRLDNGQDTAPAQHQTPKQKIVTTAHAITEIITHGRLMCSSEGSALALAVADNPGIPFHSVVLEHGISGDASTVDRFNYELATRRAGSSLDAIGRHACAKTTILLPTFEEGWAHGNLMDPEGAAAHLALTRELLIHSSNSHVQGLDQG